MLLPPSYLSWILQAVTGCGEGEYTHKELEWAFL